MVQLVVATVSVAYALPSAHGFFLSKPPFSPSVNAPLDYLTGALGVGAVDVQNHRIETPEEVAQTIQRVATIVSPERLWVNPDCGLNHLPRDVAFGKLRAMVAGTHLAKQQLVHS
jgi:cobalamin-independent methionine synthase catalytic subunit